MGISSAMMITAGAGLNAVGAYNSAKSQKQMLETEAQIGEWQAQQSIRTGQTQEENADLRSGAIFGKDRAQLAANGVQLGTGSALDLLASTKYLGLRDAATIHDNAMRTAWAYRTQSDIDRSGADAINPGLSAASSLLGSAGTVAKAWNPGKG